MSKITTTTGGVFSATTILTTTSTSLKNTAVLTTVNEAIGDKLFPSSFRGPLMGDLYQAIREGSLRLYSGLVSVSKTNPGKNMQDRWMLSLGTTLTPYVRKGTRATPDNADKLVVGVCITNYVKELAKLVDAGKLNPLTGVTKEQREYITSRSIRTFKLRTVNDSVKETV